MMDRDYDRHTDLWRRDWETRYADTGRAWDEYEPAYRYGHDLAGDSRYHGWDWDRVEPEARRGWEGSSKSAWEDFKDAVRHAWDSITGQEEHRRAA